MPGRVATRQLATSLLALLLVAATLGVQPVAADDPSIEIETDGDELTLDGAANQTIAGTSTLENGTEVVVRMRSTGGNPFIKTKTTRVRPDGRFSTSFDLSSIESAPITVRVLAKNGSVTDEVSGHIGAQPTTTRTLGIPTEIHAVDSGATATVPLTMPQGTDAVVTIENEALGYRIVARVADANDDGRVTVAVDTAAAGSSQPTIAVGEGDRFEILEPEPELDGRLPVGTYDIGVASDGDDAPVALGSLVVEGDTTQTTTYFDDTEDDAGGIPDLGDQFWRTTAPGLAGVLALLSGLASMLISRR